MYVCFILVFKFWFFVEVCTTVEESGLVTNFLVSHIYVFFLFFSFTQLFVFVAANVAAATREELGEVVEVDPRAQARHKRFQLGPGQPVVEPAQVRDPLLSNSNRVVHDGEKKIEKKKKKKKKKRAKFWEYPFLYVEALDKIAILRNASAPPGRSA
jgi:hypothetical protein